MKKINLGQILLALLGIFFIGIGVAFNASTLLGNDPIGIIYDGVRNALGLTKGQLGLVSNVVNYGLIAILFFTGRHYVNIGTFIYILPYGFFVNLGTTFYESIFITTNLAVRILVGLIGCILIYVGVGIFIAMDIGVDPFTGIVMTIRDKLKWDYKKTKVIFDIIMVIIGVLLGGKLGVITLFTALTAGPSIQWISGKISNFMNHKKRKREEEHST